MNNPYGVPPTGMAPPSYGQPQNYGSQYGASPSDFLPQVRDWLGRGFFQSSSFKPTLAPTASHYATQYPGSGLGQGPPMGRELSLLTCRVFVLRVSCECHICLPSFLFFFFFFVFFLTRDSASSSRCASALESAIWRISAAVSSSAAVSPVLSSAIFWRSCSPSAVRACAAVSSVSAPAVCASASIPSAAVKIRLLLFA